MSSKEKVQLFLDFLGIYNLEVKNTDQRIVRIKKIKKDSAVAKLRVSIQDAQELIENKTGMKAFQFLMKNIYGVVFIFPYGEVALCKNSEHKQWLEINSKQP